MRCKRIICTCVLAFVIFGAGPLGFLSAEVKKYEGRIFDIGDLNKDGKKEVIYKVGDTLGIGFFKEGNILLLQPLMLGDTPSAVINDMRTGDVDNDGDDEIVAIGKDNLYIWEKQNNRFLLDPSKTTPIYGGKRIGDPEILNKAEEEIKTLVEWSRKWIAEYGESGRYPEDELYFELSASHQEGKRITIGDFTNNGKNEIVITKSSRLIIEGGKDEEHRWRQHRYILDILSWRGRYFEVINSLISGGGNGDGGLSIFDSDGDGKNELIISGSSSYFVWEFDPEYFSGPPGMIKGIDMTGVGGFGCYAGLRIALGIVGKDVHCLVACVLATTPEWRPQEDVGRLKVFRAPIEKRPTTEELEERLVASINLPTEPLSKDKERKIAKIESIVLGDIDNDGKNEIIVNYKDGFFYIIGITNEVLVFE